MAYATGSRVICDPPVLDTDEDYVVLGSKDGYAHLIKDGYCLQTPDRGYDISGFVSLHKGNVNIIFTHDAEFYHSFVKATRLAKALNLREKKQRIVLFQAVLYGRFPK